MTTTTLSAATTRPRILIAAIVLVGLLLTVVGSSRAQAAEPGQFTELVPANTAEEVPALVAWRASSGGPTYVYLDEADPDVAVVDGQKFIRVFQGGPNGERAVDTSYPPGANGAWDLLELQFGPNRATVDAALNTGQATETPTAVTQAADAIATAPSEDPVAYDAVGNPSPAGLVKNTWTYNTAAEAAAARNHTVVSAGPTVAGLALSAVDIVSGGTVTSGSAVTAIDYSDNNPDPNAQRILTLGIYAVADEGGQSLSDMVDQKPADFTSGTTQAVRDGPYALVARVADVAVTLDATWAPSDSEWQTIVQALVVAPTSPQDVTKPTVTITKPTEGQSIPQGATVLADYSCQDEPGGSGIRTCTGAVPNGQAINTATLGAKTFAVTATDNAGNTTMTTRNYTVTAPAFAFTGFFQPVDNQPTINTAKAGSAIPVKFGLGGNRGLSVFATGYPSVVAINCATGAALSEIEQTVTAGASSLQYDAASDRYTYVWKTDKTWAGSCRRLTLQFTDGTRRSADFSLR